MLVEYVVMTCAIWLVCPPVMAGGGGSPAGGSPASPSQCVLDNVTYSTCDFATWSAWDCSGCLPHSPTPAPGAPEPRAVRIREICCDNALKSTPVQCFINCSYVFGNDNIDYSDCASACGLSSNCETIPWKVISACLFVLGLIIGALITCIVRCLVTRKQPPPGSVSPGSVSSPDDGVTLTHDNGDDSINVNDVDDADGYRGEFGYQTPKMVTCEHELSGQ